MNSKLPGKLLHLLSALAIFSCLYGCQAPSSGATAEDEAIRPSEKLVVDPDGRLSDVPVPLGASFQSDSSTSYETGTLRRVDHTYGIWAKEPLVRRFYEDNMPSHGWKLINSIAGEDSYSMNYKKGRESCRINIRPKIWPFQTLIEIRIQPVTSFN